MLQVWEDVYVPSRDDLLEHGVNDNIASRPPHPGAATVISIQSDTHNTRGDNNQYYQGHIDITASWLSHMEVISVTGLRLVSEEFNLTRDIGLLTLMG